MKRYVLFGLVLAVSATAMCWIARKVGNTPRRARRAVASIRASGAAPAGRARPVPLPSASSAQIPSSSLQVFEQADMSGPPQGLAPVVAPDASAAPGAPDGPPITDADQPSAPSVPR